MLTGDKELGALMCRRHSVIGATQVMLWQAWQVVSHKLARLCRAWKDPRLLIWCIQLTWRPCSFHSEKWAL